MFDIKNSNTQALWRFIGNFNSNLLLKRSPYKLYYLFTSIIVIISF